MFWYNFVVVFGSTSRADTKSVCLQEIEPPRCVVAPTEAAFAAMLTAENC
jgi:hypothetical protein